MTAGNVLLSDAVIEAKIPLAPPPTTAIRRGDDEDDERARAKGSLSCRWVIRTLAIDTHMTQIAKENLPR